ncbi:hypothetical protein ACFVIY_37930 [Streptomyces sp. NPDC127166]|uniref:hypothetical protein n=1 Tax=Streptomyces sp. NPDC127166 TaxID=3345380 RepID=UPI003639B1E7
MTDHDQDDDAPEYLDADDHMTNADVFTADELHEMDQADEYRLDAEQEERDAREAAEAEAAAEPYDTEPWLGYADGDER